MRSNATLSAKTRITNSVGAALVAGAPMTYALGLLFASPATATPAMCAVDPAAYQTPGVCQTAQQAISSATQSGHSALLHASGIAPAYAGDANSLPEVNGIPCTGLNTGKCIGLQLAAPPAAG